MIAVLSFDFKRKVSKPVLELRIFIFLAVFGIVIKLFHRCFHNKSKMWLPQGKSRNVWARLERLAHFGLSDGCWFIFWFNHSFNTASNMQMLSESGIFFVLVFWMCGNSRLKWFYQNGRCGVETSFHSIWCEAGVQHHVSVLSTWLIGLSASYCCSLWSLLLHRWRDLKTRSIWNQ